MPRIFEAPPGFVLNPDYLVPELKAQRDALLEALGQCLNGTLIGGHTHNDNGLEALAERCGSPHVATELRRLAGIARAAIKAVEGEA